MSLFSSNDEHFCTPFALRNDTNTGRGQIEKTRLEPENEYGNVEYKLRLTDPTAERIERLVTQLKWRIREGHGEAILYLGVKDNGLFVGLTAEEIRLSMQTLERMSLKIGAKMKVVNEKIVDPALNDDTTLENQLALKGQTARNRSSMCRVSKKNISASRVSVIEHVTESKSKKPTLNNKSKKAVRKVIQVLFKRKTHDISEELRVAVLGPTESGKSSLLGVLSRGEHDNGRGSARLNLFRHRHEIRSGHTSSISQEIFGFNCHGQPLTYNTCLTTEEIIEASSRIVTLIDLAGHQRYLSTTLFGLGSHSPDIVLLVISAISPITSVTTDNISLALGIGVSLAIVINKVDLASKEDQENCFEELIRALQTLHPEVTPIKIAGVTEAITAGHKLRETQALPIFFSSCVTGAGLDSLYGFFNCVSPNLTAMELNTAISRSSELQVDETFEVPGIGTVVSGLMIQGTIREGDEMLLGPDDQGSFMNVTILSLQRHKVPCNFVRAGQKCTMAIKANNMRVRRGMVLKELDADQTDSFSVCSEFEAEIKFITNKQYKLGINSQVSIYIGNVKQTCTILSIDSSTDGHWLIQMRLSKRPEYIRSGSKLIVRHALTKGIGIVSRVLPLLVNELNRQ